MKSSEMERFFSGKMKFSRSDGTKHDRYHYSVRGERPAFPSMFTLSRGGKEMSRRNLDGLAQGFGVPLDILVSAAECNVCRQLLVIALYIRVIGDVVDRYRMYGELDRDRAVRAALVVIKLLEEEDLVPPSKIRAHELKMVQILEGNLKKISQENLAEVSTVGRALSETLGKYWK